MLTFFNIFREEPLNPNVESSKKYNRLMLNALSMRLH